MARGVNGSMSHGGPVLDMGVNFRDGGKGIVWVNNEKSDILC